MTKNRASKKAVRAEKQKGVNYTEALREKNKATHIGYLAYEEHKSIAKEILPLLAKLSHVKFPLTYNGTPEKYQEIPWVYDSESGGMIFVHMDGITVDSVLNIWLTDSVSEDGTEYTEEVKHLSKATHAVIGFMLPFNDRERNEFIISLPQEGIGEKIDTIVSYFKSASFKTEMADYLKVASGY